MPKKYAIRITEDNLELVRVMCPQWNIMVEAGDTDRYFLFTTVACHNTTTDHDIVDEDNLYGYDGMQKDMRVILL